MRKPRISAAVDDALLTAIDAEVNRRGITRARLVRQACAREVGYAAGLREANSEIGRLRAEVAELRAIVDTIAR